MLACESTPITGYKRCYRSLQALAAVFLGACAIAGSSAITSALHEGATRGGSLLLESDEMMGYDISDRATCSGLCGQVKRYRSAASFENSTLCAMLVNATAFDPLMRMINDYVNSPAMQSWFDPHWIGQALAFSREAIVLNTSKADPRLRYVQKLAAEAALTHDSSIAPYALLSVIHGTVWTLVSTNHDVDFWELQHFLCGEEELWRLGMTFMVLRECMHGIGHGALMRASSEAVPACGLTRL